MDSDIKLHRSGLQEDRYFLTDSSGAMISLDELTKVIQRIDSEHLDINWFETGSFVNGSVWVAMDRELYTVAIDTTLLGLLRKLATAPEELAKLVEGAQVNPDDL